MNIADVHLKTKQIMKNDVQQERIEYATAQKETKESATAQ